MKARTLPFAKWLCGQHQCMPISNLAVRAEVARSAQVLHLFDNCAAHWAGFPGGVLVHQADVTARMAVQVDFVVTTTVSGYISYCVADGAVQFTYLAGLQPVDRVPGVEFYQEQDVLCYGVPQAGNELVLGEQAFGAALFTGRKISD